MDAKNNSLENMTTQLYRERQLGSGNESVEIRYVNGSFEAGTSASSPGIPRHKYILARPISLKGRGGICLPWLKIIWSLVIWKMIV